MWSIYGSETAVSETAISVTWTKSRKTLAEAH